jgi:hypothetical protein
MEARVVRLSEPELRAVLAAAFPGQTAKAKGLSFNLQGDYLTPARDRAISSADLGSYRSATADLTAAFVAGLPAGHACAATATAKSCMSETLEPMLTMLFRRPLDEAERSAFTDQFNSISGGHGALRGAEAVLAGALLSPQVLYRTESGDGTDAGTFRLTADEAVQMVSLALRGEPASAEDTADLETLDAGAFKDRLATLATAWADSDGFRARMKGFLAEYLAAAKLMEIEKEDPAWNDTTRAALREEFEGFLDDTFLTGGGTFGRLFTADRARRTAGTAALYSADELEGDEVVWKHGDRRGALGLAAVLAANASPTASDPVKRGLLVRHHLLCEDVPPPDPDVDFTKLPELPDVQTRERFEILGQEPSCRPCHQVINPPGYLFEHFDEMGRFRAEQLGRPINAKGDLPAFFGKPAYPGTTGENEWDGLGPLADWLADSERARRCFTVKFIDYALAGTVPDGIRNCGVDRAARKFMETGELATLVGDVARSDLFLTRKREGVSP